MKKKIIIYLGALVFIIVYLFFSKGIIEKVRWHFPILKIKGWSIGIYAGHSPKDLAADRNICNPVLTARDVKDVRAAFVADPFMIFENNEWNMFMEVKNSETKKGEIGLAKSKNGRNWEYKKIILAEQFHLSYPYVFKVNREYFMIPESVRGRDVRLYKAFSFPEQWIFVKKLFNDVSYSDSSIYYFNRKWWMLTCSGNHDTLHLFYANEIMGAWREHPRSPIIKGNPQRARPAGRVLVNGGRIIRYAQEDFPKYGRRVWGYEIIEQSTTNYMEREISDSPIIQETGTGWNSKGMHHIDAHEIGKNRWIACVDGRNIDY